MFIEVKRGSLSGVHFTVKLGFVWQGSLSVEGNSICPLKVGFWKGFGSVPVFVS